MSPISPPMPAESHIDAPVFLMARHAMYPENVPTMPMDKVFAPMVVMPPCPRNVWKNSAIAEITTVGNGPIIIAAIAVPAGCEHDPVTGTGMCQTDITKTAAPKSPTMDMYAGLIFRLFDISYAPIATKMAATINQVIAH